MTFDLCVVTDARLSRGRTHMEIARLAIRGGATWIQFREKDASTREMIERGRELRGLTREAGATLIVNDRVDVALAIDADGVHVGQEDMPAGIARRLIGPELLLGVSARSVEEAVQGERDGADYLGVGPIFPTSTKHVEAPPIGLDGLTALVAQVRIPVVAIGGIHDSNVEAVVDAGADGVAVISAVVNALDPEEAARILRVRIMAAKAHRS